MTIYLNTKDVNQNPFYQTIRSGYLFNYSLGKMRAAAFMSGSGSNFKEIYKTQKSLESKLNGKSPFEIVCVFTDTEKGYENAGKIITDITGKIVTIPRIYLNPKKVIPEQYLITQDKTLRESERLIYDEKAVSELMAHNVNCGILAGYMRLLSPYIINRMLCMNVHPGPLNIIDPFTGKRKFTGDSAVKKQILAGREYLQSTVNVAREGADTGEILMLSNRLPVDLEGHTFEKLISDSNLLEEIANKNQSKLKEVGDLNIFPKVVIFAAKSLYTFDKNWQIKLNHPRHLHHCNLQFHPEEMENWEIDDYYDDLISNLIHYNQKK